MGLPICSYLPYCLLPTVAPGDLAGAIHVKSLLLHLSSSVPMSLPVQVVWGGPLISSNTIAMSHWGWGKLGLLLPDLRPSPP